MTTAENLHLVHTSVRLTPENRSRLVTMSWETHLSQGAIVNVALDRYFDHLAALLLSDSTPRTAARPDAIAMDNDNDFEWDSL